MRQNQNHFQKRIKNMLKAKIKTFTNHVLSKNPKNNLNICYKNNDIIKG